MKVIPYGRQEITQSDIDAVTEVLRGDFLTQGPAVSRFENGISSYLKRVSGEKGEVFSIAVNNGTTALHLACLSLGLEQGDRVIVTPISFAATANCVRYCGAEVEFVDVDPNTGCLDLLKLEHLLDSAPRSTFKGVIIVDFAGYLPDMERLREIADQHNLWVIEDACHAIGATRVARDGLVYTAGGCRFSDIATFSFHPVKHIATGEGGMVLTRSKKIFEKISLLRTHGITKDPNSFVRGEGAGGWYYEMQCLGYNGRLSDISCALGHSQLSRLASNIETRQKIADRYIEAFSDLPLQLPKADEKVKHAYHLFVVKTPHRKALYEYLFEYNIRAQVHYIPIHKLPYYAERYGEKALPASEQYYASCLSLPMYHSLELGDQDRVIQTVKNFFRDLS